MQEEHYFTPAEVAQRFRVTRQAVYNWINEGKLPAVRLGQAIRIPSSALQSFVQPVRPGEATPEGDDEQPEPRGNKYCPALLVA